MLTALTLGFVLGPSLQQKIDNSNFKSYFDQCERKGAYLESPPENSSGSPQFLGKLTASKYGADSIANSYGKYGSTTGQESIWNAYSKFGGKFSARSPWNSYARKPVEILYREGTKTYIAGYLTANAFYRGEIGLPNIDPKYLAYWLDRAKDIPK
ncbi:MAG: hypothetical protein BGO01_00370 [Armatimonadetes bacterium 55-13]|nr:hypothetical protein [Armatimonadota bacterium]OJU63154.1 MAG: hypothetical protein BGO01_00370 [Armatimonadetes bacterium 55-13]